MGGKTSILDPFLKRIAELEKRGLKMDAESRMARAEKLGARPTTDEDLLSSDDVLWHGSPSGYLVGRGVHLGTPKAAEEALEARIGVPASGRGWRGDTAYKDTPLMGDARLPSMKRTGYNARDVPQEDYLPTRMPNYGDRSPMTGDELPSVRPYMVTGEMTNSPYRPMSDERANAVMSAQQTRGTAKRGYYYTNEGEDVGSVSAVVPGIDHVVPLNKEMLYTLPNGRLRSRFAAFDPARIDSRDLLAGGLPVTVGAGLTLDDIRAYLAQQDGGD